MLGKRARGTAADKAGPPKSTQDDPDPPKANHGNNAPATTANRVGIGGGGTSTAANPAAAATTGVADAVTVNPAAAATTAAVNAAAATTITTTVVHAAAAAAATTTAASNRNVDREAANRETPTAKLSYLAAPEVRPKGGRSQTVAKGLSTTLDCSEDMTVTTIKVIDERRYIIELRKQERRRQLEAAAATAAAPSSASALTGTRDHAAPAGRSFGPTEAILDGDDGLLALGPKTNVSQRTCDPVTRTVAGASESCITPSAPLSDKKKQQQQQQQQQQLLQGEEAKLQESDIQELSFLIPQMENLNRLIARKANRAKKGSRRVDRRGAKNRQKGAPSTAETHQRRVTCKGAKNPRRDPQDPP